MAAIAAAACITPVAAEVQPGTTSLLETIQDNGIVVTYNHPDCATNGALGQYRWAGFQREIRLCTGDTVDAQDHNTVRHEVVHAIQHCVNAARGTDENTPIVTDQTKFKAFIVQNLSNEMINLIMEAYPESQWLVELEAFAGANALTATELKDIFLDVCVAPETGI